MPGSGQQDAACPPQRDRRVRRTERVLHEALGTLMHKKPYEAIGVKEILHHADVGRSTFYEHFGNKDELLAAAIDEVVRSASQRDASGEPALRFALPLFEHIARFRTPGSPPRVRNQPVVHEHLRRAVEASLLQQWRTQPAGAGPGDVPADLRARHVAATLLVVIDWWMQHWEAVTPREADRMFRALLGDTAPS